MEFNEAAKIRVGMLIHHIEIHMDEYEQFARHCEEKGTPEFSQKIREMVNLTNEITHCLQDALEVLNGRRNQ